MGECVNGRLIGRLSEVTLKNKKGFTVELLPTMPANTAELVQLCRTIIISFSLNFASFCVSYAYVQVQLDLSGRRIGLRLVACKKPISHFSTLLVLRYVSQTG